MNRLRKLAGLAALLSLIVPSMASGQTPDKEKDKTQAQDQDADHGFVDFGVRFATGDVYGRPDLPFDPPLKNSKFNEYRDVRDGFFLRKADVRFNDVFGTKNYVSFQTSKSIYRDQSYLVGFGSYGKFKTQFRYDEIPHIYSDTTRTLFTENFPGNWTYPALIRQTLQAPVPQGNSLQNIVNTQVIPQSNFITPSIIRRGGTGSLSYNLNSRWSVHGLFFRESQRGLRPIGLIMNSSPSASATSGFGVELPEPIDYFNNLVVAGIEYGWKRWGLAASYIGSFFDNNIKQLTWDNPFRLTNETTSTPLTGRMTLYPDNHKHSLDFAGTGDLGKYLHFTASIAPGWLRQDAPFFPYSTNTAINTCGAALNQACTDTAALPEANLHGSVQTLAMNYTLVSNPWKNLELKANYRHYDYNDNTPIFDTWTPVEGDVGVPNAATLTDNTPFGFNRKNLELTGNWYFAKRSSLKLGYEAEWMDRTHRDVAHSLENSFFTAVDWVPIKDLLFRVAYRHQDRMPDSYQDDQAFDPATGNEITCADMTNVSFTNDQRCHRRFDEAARLRNRGDALLQYSPTDRMTFSGFFGTTQDNYGIKGDTNSPVALNFVPGTTNPYYSYGLQKDLSYNWGFDADFAISTTVTMFAEYSHERYHKRMITRYRTPESTSGTNGCGPSSLGTPNQGACDTANNDWESTAQEPVDIYAAGADWTIGKKLSFTTYYSLSAGRANVNSRPLGDPVGHPFLTAAGAAPNDPNRFQLVGTNAAVDYPETVNRTHEVAAVFRYKLTEHFTPRFEYRYQQWDNRDYQTTVITPYMGCVSAAPPSAPVFGCATPILNSSTSPTPLPGGPSPFYPGFVVGDPSSARYLFLGVDQPSYHAHTIMATLEYRF
jgi:MtrB/PioB family decaheme-associated outer membrane protein